MSDKYTLEMMIQNVTAGWVMFWMIEANENIYFHRCSNDRYSTQSVWWTYRSVRSCNCSIVTKPLSHDTNSSSNRTEPHAICVYFMSYFRFFSPIKLDNVASKPDEKLWHFQYDWNSMMRQLIRFLCLITPVIVIFLTIFGSLHP